MGVEDLLVLVERKGFGSLSKENEFPGDDRGCVVAGRIDS